MDILHQVLAFAAKGFVVFATVALTVAFCVSIVRRKRPAGSRLRVERLNRRIEALGDALRGKLAHDDLTAYNTAQRAAYVAIILAIIVLVASGLAIWKPVQLQWLAAPMGGYEGARLVHFFAMCVVVSVTPGTSRASSAGVTSVACVR